MKNRIENYLEVENSDMFAIVPFENEKEYLFTHLTNYLFRLYETEEYKVNLKEELTSLDILNYDSVQNSLLKIASLHYGDFITTAARLKELVRLCKCEADFEKALDTNRCESTKLFKCTKDQYSEYTKEMWLYHSYLRFIIFNLDSIRNTTISFFTSLLTVPFVTHYDFLDLTELYATSHHLNTEEFYSEVIATIVYGIYKYHKCSRESYTFSKIVKDTVKEILKNEVIRSIS